MIGKAASLPIILLSCSVGSLFPFPFPISTQRYGTTSTAKKRYQVQGRFSKSTNPSIHPHAKRTQVPLAIAPLPYSNNIPSFDEYRVKLLYTKHSPPSRFKRWHDGSSLANSRRGTEPPGIPAADPSLHAAVNRCSFC
jgi:hypothetical protein